MTNTTFFPAQAAWANHAELNHFLTKLVESGPAQEVLPMALRVLGHPVVLCNLLRAAADSPAWLQAVQEASYYHRNGFHKLVLLQGTHFKLRLHHFEAQGATVPPAENIHDHRWPFASAIVSGSLHMKLFEPHVATGVPVEAYEYNSQRGQGNDRAVWKRSCFLRTTSYQVYEAGDQYFMPTTLLHQIVYVPGRQALTLMLTGKPERTTCRLFAKGKLQAQDLEETPYATDFLQHKLNALARHLQP